MAQDTGPSGDPVRLEGMEVWGRVTRVMEPDYPKDALARKLSGFVDITGAVSPTGRLRNVEYKASSEEAKIFIEPLAQVIEHWAVAPPLDAQCQPHDLVVKNRVWFDLSEDRPKMSVALLREPGEKPAAPPFKRISGKDPVYPYRMQRMGWQANVFAKVGIAPDGSVVSVDATAYPKQPRVDLTQFEEEVKQAAAKWKYPATGRPGTLFGCYQIFFRLKG